MDPDLCCSHRYAERLGYLCVGHFFDLLEQNGLPQLWRQPHDELGQHAAQLAPVCS